MAVSLGEAILKIGADSSSFEKKVKRLDGVIRKRMGDMSAKVVAGIKTTMFAAAAGIGAATAAITKSVLDTAAFGDSMDEMSQRTGFSVKALSEFKYAADLTGTSIEGIEKGIKKMSRTIDDARDGMKSANDTLAKLGLSANDFKGKSPERAFEIITARLADVKDEMTKSAIAQEIFGRSGTELLPMLSQGSAGLKRMREEANRLGVVMSEKDARAAAELQDNIDRLKFSFQGLRFAVGSQLIPVINEYVMKATEWVASNRELIAVKVREYIAKIVEQAKLVWAEFQKWIPTLQSIAKSALDLGAALVPIGKFLAEHYKWVIGIAAAWKAAALAYGAYQIASGLNTIYKKGVAEKLAKAGKAAAPTAAGAAGATVGKAGMLATGAWGLSGGAAAGAGLGIGTLANEHLGIRKGWLWAAGWDRKDKRADAPITQADIAASRAQAQASAGGTTINISNLSVNADDVVTAKNFQNMLTQKAHKSAGVPRS